MKFSNWLLKVSGREYEIESKIFRRALSSYPYGSDSSGQYLSHITNVQAFQKPDGIVRVLIVSHHPGILIGKAGKQIKEIKEYMEYLSNKTVDIDIRESEIFKKLYE